MNVIVVILLLLYVQIMKLTYKLVNICLGREIAQK